MNRNEKIVMAGMLTIILAIGLGGFLIINHLSSQVNELYQIEQHSNCKASNQTNIQRLAILLGSQAPETDSNFSTNFEVHLNACVEKRPAPEVRLEIEPRADRCIHYCGTYGACVLLTSDYGIMECVQNTNPLNDFSSQSEWCKQNYTTVDLRKGIPTGNYLFEKYYSSTEKVNWCVYKNNKQ